MKSVYGDGYMSQTQVFTLHKKFLEGRKTAELRDSQCSGQPSINTIYQNYL